MGDTTSLDAAPRAEYERRLTRARSLGAESEARATRLSNLRLLLFLLAAVGVVLAARDTLPWHVLWLPAAAFAALVVLHQRAERGRFDAERRASIYERGLARIDDRWAGTGGTGEAWRPEGDLAAADLDLFGQGSLFQLLSTARTQAGEEHLAQWLVAGATPTIIRARQQAVEELRDALDLREDLAIVGSEVHGALDREGALAWATEGVRLRGRVVPWVVRVLGLLTTTLCMGWLFGPWPMLPFLIAAAGQFLVVAPWLRRVESVLAGADQPSRDLDLVSRLLRRFEGATFRSPYLRDLTDGLRTSGVEPSASIAQLTRLMDFVEARRNQIFLPLSWLLGLGTQLAFAIERWRGVHGDDLARWVDTLGTLEAVISLSAYAYEHPTDPFPEILDEGAVFDGQGIGHPLLPTKTNVRNDVHLAAPTPGAPPQALLVSGSNMSGKSTLLRSVGINVALAMAGAPVRATALRLTRLRIGASIRVNDSLRDGESRFYAEIARLRKVVDLARSHPPALFLLDEMLGGTNSHDRRIGAEAVIRSLLDAGAIGLVTTHDLALADIATGTPSMENVHFEDRMEAGRMHFDYRMRPGVVTRSNAIPLMRAVGLDV